MRRLKALLRDTTANLRHDLTTTVATVLTAAVALCLLGTAMLANAQIAAMKDHWYDRVEVTVFLCTEKSDAATCKGEPTAAAKKAVYEALRELQGVQAVYYETREDAWKAFQDRFEGTSVSAGLTPDALPESFRVKMTDPSMGYIIEQAAAGVTGIETVQDQRKLLGRFFSLLTKVQQAAAGVAATALIAAAVLIATGVRATIAYRQREITIMRLVGAHAGKIRRPFLLASILQGALGGVLAAIGVLVLKAWMLDAQVASNSLNRVVSWSTTLEIATSLIAVGAVTAGIVSAANIARRLHH